MPETTRTGSWTMDDCGYCQWHDAPWDIDEHEPGCYWHNERISSKIEPQQMIIPTIEDVTETWEQALAADYAEADSRYGFAVPQKSIPLDNEPMGTPKWKTFARTCTHALDPYYLTDGTEVYLSGWFDRRSREWEPDLAVYLDDAWIAETIAFTVGWPDYGLPYMPDSKVIKLAKAVHAQAKTGDTVEIACAGGHGRTGTFLAILECVSMERAMSHVAIDRVRKNHCEKAIETPEQEWWIESIAAQLNGDDPPKYVPKWVTPSKPIVSKGKQQKKQKGGRRRKRSRKH